MTRHEVIAAVVAEFGDVTVFVVEESVRFKHAPDTIEDQWRASVHGKLSCIACAQTTKVEDLVTALKVDHADRMAKAKAELEAMVKS